MINRVSLERVVEVQSRKYTVEFKQQAVELAKSLGSTKKAADQLGIPDVNIHQWRKRFTESQSPDAEVSKQDLLEELKKLRRENTEQKQVIHILKSAAAFFSQDHLK